jgi:hypothetical protein
MYEKIHIVYIVAIIFIAVLSFAIGRFSIRPGAADSYGNGNGSSELNEQLIGSIETTRDLENRLTRINITSEHITEQLVFATEKCMATGDNIEKLRILFQEIEKIYDYLNDIYFDSLIGFNRVDSEQLKEKE